MCQSLRASYYERDGLSRARLSVVAISVTGLHWNSNSLARLNTMYSKRVRRDLSDDRNMVSIARYG